MFFIPAVFGADSSVAAHHQIGPSVKEKQIEELSGAVAEDQYYEDQGYGQGIMPHLFFHDAQNDGRNQE